MEKTLRLQNRLKDHRYEVIGKLHQRGLYVGEDYFIEVVTLQGSQNYGTDHAGSDVDSKMVVTPSHKSLIMGRKFNETVILENGEHCDIKTGSDIIMNICKGNINWIEGLYTDFYVGGSNWWHDMRNLRDSIVGVQRMRIMSAVYGMAQQKMASLYKPTETTRPYFEKHGFDNKNFIHTIRLVDFATMWEQGYPFRECLDFSSRMGNLMSKLQSGSVRADVAQDMGEHSLQLINKLYHTMKERGVEDSKEDTRGKLVERYAEWVC